MGTKQAKSRVTTLVKQGYRINHTGSSGTYSQAVAKHGTTAREREDARHHVRLKAANSLSGWDKPGGGGESRRKAMASTKPGKPGR